MDGLDKIDGVHFVTPKGAFYLFPGFSDLKVSDEELAVYALQKTGVVTIIGWFRKNR